jgi:hypothetical protein
MTAMFGMRPHNPHPVASTQLKTPILDHNAEGLKVENALLHRRLLYLMQQDIKLRAALELATGEPWDSQNLTDLSGDQLEEVVANNMAHGLQISMEEARKRVRDHKAMANPAQIKGEKASP